MEQRTIAERLKVFVDAGLVTRIPTPWQLRQAEIEMTPYVVSTDVTAEEGYIGAPLGNPVVRQPIIFFQIGLDHLGTGSALGAKLDSLCTHLQLTHHRGMPVFDLQAVQTHEGGLARLRASIGEILDGSTPYGRRRARIASLILGDPRGYFARFLGDDGWIARAERFDYPTPSDQGSNMPVEFFSLVGLIQYSAAHFAVDRSDIPWSKLPSHLVRLFTRRFREGQGLGWIGGKG